MILNSTLTLTQFLKKKFKNIFLKFIRFINITADLLI